MHNPPNFMRAATTTVALAAVSSTAGAGMAMLGDETERHAGEVTFTSDLKDPKPIVLPGFDTGDGDRILLGVEVNVTHSGSIIEAADNDDPFQSAVVRGRMIRQWTATGPDVVANGFQSLTSDFFDLAPDDGDLEAFDPTKPDGVFIGTLAYEDLAAGSFAPDPALYEDVTSVAFDVFAVLMVNDLQFDGLPPDSWQLEVQRPRMIVEVEVVYTYELAQCEFTAEITGECPGEVSCQVRCGTPGGEFAWLFAGETGSAVIQDGPCAGVVLGLGRHAHILATGILDANGDGGGSGFLSREDYCNGFFQAIDVESCALSEVIQVGN